MNILIGLVIAMFIIVGGYVGYHASQQIMVEEVEGHDITAELEILNENTELIETLQLQEIRKSIV
ncbi:MAG: hypothetical protein OER82_09750 [Nitrosopumilus sp.]|nr:hypothetical protein [Nitrosopumilus sp.]